MSTRSIRNGVGAGALAAMLCVAVAGVAACGAPGRSTSGGRDDGAASSTASQADEDALVAAHQAWIRAFERGDAETALSLLEHSEQLLIYHPFLDNRFDGYAEAARGVKRMLEMFPRLSWLEVHQAARIEGNVGWITSQIMITGKGLEPPFIGRGTEIWVRNDAGWHLAHGHWSEHAELASRGQATDAAGPQRNGSTSPDSAGAGSGPR